MHDPLVEHRNINGVSLVKKTLRSGIVIYTVNNQEVRYWEIKKDSKGNETVTIEK